MTEESMQAPAAPPERKILEAILLLADEPVSAGEIGQVLERPRFEVVAALQELAASYVSEGRGFVLREVGEGWRLYTSPDCGPWLERLVRTRSHARLTGAALEVLAIVAYRQPLSRSQITEVRGVDSDGVVKTLLQRGLIEETGHHEGPGAPALFGVTREFLERMGLGSVDEMPPLSDFMPDAEAVEDMEAKLSPNA
ncbi:MAG: SMC-Scp complex subunit ScpB [Actinomycetota bacterium]